METRVSTIIVEPRSLVREALVSLIGGHSYQVVGSFASTADIENSLRDADAPKLVILGALPGDGAVSAAASIRKLWPNTKIILLFDSASSADVQKLLASEFDGCIPLFASPDTLVGTLQQIIAGNLKILVFNAEAASMPCSTGWQVEGDVLGRPSRTPAPSDDENGSIDRTNSLRIVHGLSPREDEILKSVVRGHSNKMIARTCGVSDATVKVHMKSILRKIRVENRTQAAIWAVGHGYGADASHRSPALRPQHELAAA